MARPDPFLTLLADIAFLPLRLPRSGIEPLALVSKAGKDLTILGKLQEAFTGSDLGAPPISRDIGTAASVQRTRTSRIQLSVGLSLLQNILQALTGKSCEISGGFESASSLVLEFAGVSVDRADLVELDRYLGRAVIHPDSRHVRTMLVKGDCGVITAVLRCRRYLVTAHTQNGGQAAINLPLLQKAVAGQVRVTAAGEDSRRIAFEGPDPLAIGVQAVQLFYTNDGRFSAFDPIAPGSAAVRGLAEPIRLPKMFTADGAFVRLAA